MAHTLHTTYAFIPQLYTVWYAYRAVQEHTLCDSVHYTEQSHIYIYAHVVFNIESHTQVLVLHLL
jgi:hypothetical protein